MRRTGNRKPRRPSPEDAFPDELLRLLQVFDARLKGGLIDTSTSAFYAVMANIVQLQMAMLSEQLDRHRTDIGSDAFQDFITAMGKLYTRSHHRRKQPRKTMQ